jgi:hypothetical protein
MSIHSKGIRETVWGLVTGIKERLPLLSADQQTRLSWLKVIKSYDEAPDVYRSAFEAFVSDGQFPYAVLTPSYAGFINRENEKLVFCLDDKIYVLEEVTGILTCTCYAIKDISHIEVGKVLLQSWVKLSGVAGRGLPITTEFKFNTITDHLFAPIVKKMRSATDYSLGPDPGIEQAKFDFLSRANLKLMNYARRSLLPDEKVVDIILQPEIRAEVLKLFGNSFFRTVCLAHLGILTDWELILIQEGTGKRWGGDIRYGGVWHYIPLDKITSISLTGPEDELLTMSVRLPGDDCLDSLFSVSNRQEVDGFLNRFRSSHRAGWVMA